MAHEPSRRSRPPYRPGSAPPLLCFAFLPAAQARAANPCAPPSFNAAPVINFSVVNPPSSVASADFNRDGRADLAVARQGFAELVVLIGVGNGNFEERSRREVFMASGVRTGDFNGDGAADIAVALGQDNTVAIFQGDGAGNFAGPFSFYAGAGLAWMSGADFNADGKLDLVVTGVTIVPLLNTLGTGTPTVQLCPSDYSVGEGVRGFQVLVSRGGDTSGAATVAYTTQNNTATDTGDYSAAVGTLRFAPGEISKSFPVFVNVGEWQARLEANKRAYALDFVRRQRFADAFPASMTAEEFVTKLDQNAGSVLSTAERAQLVSSLAPAPSDAERRAAVLRQVAEHQTLRQRELNRAFVLMEFYGYLRRNPDDAPDADFRGWKFWLDKLNQFNGDAVAAEMVKAFITSDEYRKRFGQ